MPNSEAIARMIKYSEENGWEEYSYDCHCEKCNNNSGLIFIKPDGILKIICTNCGFSRLLPSLKRYYGMSKNRSTQHTKWSYAVRKRDNFTCKTCGSKENLEAHHIIPYSVNEKLRYEISNGITLCRTCHNKIHSEEL